MKCPKCGYEVQESFEVCPFCGTKIDKVQQDLNIENVGHSKNVKRRRPRRKKKIMRSLGEKIKADSKKTSFYIKLSILIILLVIFILFLVSGGFSLLNGKRTIMIYMIGSNLESQKQSGTKDIQEMVNSGANFGKDVNVVICTGGTKKWENAEIPNDKISIFNLTNDGLEKLEEFPSVSMTNPNTLTRFLNYAFKNFKATKYSLILWDHGGGPIGGYGIDENYPLGSLSMIKVKEALNNSSFKKRKLEFIGFDACLMANIEIASALSDKANYLVASEDLELVDGWCYNFLGAITKKTDSFDLVNNITDSFSTYYHDGSKGKGITLSAIDLSKAKDVEDEINKLFKKVDINSKFDFSRLSKLRQEVRAVGKAPSNPGRDLVDLYDLINKFPKGDTEKLRQDILDMIVCQVTDLNNVYGVSIYFPYESSKYYDKIMAKYRTFNFAPEYTDFINEFSSKLTDEKVESDWDTNLSKSMPTVKNNDLVQLKVDSEVVDNYSSISYIVMEKLKDGNFAPRFKGSDISLNGNIFSVNINKKELVAYNSKDSITIPILESELGKDYVIYLIPAVVKNWGNNILDKFEVESVYLEFIVDKEHPNGYISDLVPVNKMSATGDILPATKARYKLNIT